MPSVLDFERYGSELSRQLLRRIGYTNGLHKIRRFARVVEYVYKVMPTSVAELTQIIIREENARGESQLGGVEYAAGIIDVARALLLLERFGPKIALSSQGYACHALMRTSAPEPHIDPFLFHKVVEADGEYTLNILRLINEGISEPTALGEALFARFLALIEYKKGWVDSNVLNRFSQRALVSMLDEARVTLEKAIKNKPSHVDFFFKHTINPRVEWLQDLGCVVSRANGGQTCTDKGVRILDQIKGLGGWQGQFVFLPLDQWLAAQLDIPNLYRSTANSNFTWRLVAATVNANPEETALGDHAILLGEIKAIYQYVKLANFNEADALSLYEVMAARAADGGKVLPQEPFEHALAELVREFPDEIFKLSKRRGKGLYIALKKTA